MNRRKLIISGAAASFIIFNAGVFAQNATSSDSLQPVEIVLPETNAGTTGIAEEAKNTAIPSNTEASGATELQTADIQSTAGSEYKKNAVASYYAEKYHGCTTANGEIFDMNAFTAAHRTLPFNTMVKVTNLANNKSVTVRINDRGPFVDGREIDVSKAAAIALDMVSTGTADVSLSIIYLPEETVATEKNNVASSAIENSIATPDGNTASTTVATNTTNPTAATNAAYTGPLWRIQIGAYAAESNAYNLVKKLRAAGFSPAYEKNGNIIRVVLPGIQDNKRTETEAALKSSGFSDYLVRRER